jgi:hypothetical protein
VNSSKVRNVESEGRMYGSRKQNCGLEWQRLTMKHQSKIVCDDDDRETAEAAVCDEVTQLIQKVVRQSMDWKIEKIESSLCVI